MDEKPAILTPEEARQGRKVGRMRYVLGISLTAIIIILAFLLARWI